MNIKIFIAPLFLALILTGCHEVPQDCQFPEVVQAALKAKFQREAVGEFDGIKHIQRLAERIAEAKYKVVLQTCIENVKNERNPRNQILKKGEPKHE